MKRNTSIRTTMSRSSHGTNFIYNLALDNCSLPRLMLEVFTRRRFGPAYLTLGSILWLTFLLVVSPPILHWMSEGFEWLKNSMHYTRPHSRPPYSYSGYITWYIFTLAFLVMALKRFAESRKAGSIINFETTSDYPGDISLVLYTLLGKNDRRKIETLLEPGLFLVIGFILRQWDQHLGTLLIIASIIYSLSYFGAYQRGDNRLRELNDQPVRNQNLWEIQQAFFDRNNDKKDFHISRPNSPNKLNTNPDKKKPDGGDEPPAVFKI